MPIVNILTFFVIFTFIVLTGLYIYLTFYNKRVQTTIDKFIRQATGFKPTVFQNIKLRYWTTSGLKTRISPNNYCDLYLFDNSIAVVRRQHFIFKVFFPPILLTSDIATAKSIFDYINTYKPYRIIFGQTAKSEVHIKLTDPTYKHYTTDITLKGLTNEQRNQLEKIKKWTNS